MLMFASMLDPHFHIGGCMPFGISTCAEVCISICICIYICMYGFFHVCSVADMHIHRFIHIYICMCIFISIPYVHMCTGICLRICVYICSISFLLADLPVLVLRLRLTLTSARLVLILTHALYFPTRTLSLILILILILTTRRLVCSSVFLPGTQHGTTWESPGTKT